MSNAASCPECGAPRIDHRYVHRGNCADPSRRELDFYRVLNGTQWREKPIAPPRHRDDVVPND